MLPCFVLMQNLKGVYKILDEIFKVKDVMKASLGLLKQAWPSFLCKAVSDSIHGSRALF